MATLLGPEDEPALARTRLGRDVLATGTGPPGRLEVKCSGAFLPRLVATKPQYRGEGLWELRGG